MKKIKVQILKQIKDACGPTCFKMVLKYYGNDIPLKEIINGMGGIKRDGVSCIKMCEYGKNIGYNIFCHSFNAKKAKGQAKITWPSKELIIKYLKQGIPVIITVRAFILWRQKYSKMGHYIVITGYKNGYFWYNDPQFAKELRVRENDLIFAWYNNIVDNSGYLLAIEPSKKISKV